MALQEMANDLSLHQCMISRNKAKLMSILDSDVDMTKQDFYGRTALHVAAMKHYQEGVELLLERGADVNMQSDHGDTPLHEAINNNYEMVKTLLNRGALPNYRNIRGKTPLFRAVINENLPIINLLLNADADTNLEDSSGILPLHVAVSNRSHEIIKLLLDRGANIEAKCKQGLSPLHIAVRYDCVVKDSLTTQMLLDKGANPNAISDSKYFISVSDFSIALGSTPLHLAASYLFPSVLKVLLDGGANPNIKNGDGFVPLHLASKGNNSLLVVMIDLLIQGGAIVDLINIKGDTALHEAVNSMAPGNVECLLQAGANVNAQNEKGETPLHLAVSKSGFGWFQRKRLFEVIQILLDWGASVNLTNNKGETVLDAAYGGQLDLVKKHFVKLVPLNGSLFKENVITDFKGYESYHTSCLEELGLIKKKKCGKYSFSDVFYMYNNPYYVNSISMEKELSLLHIEFPIYASLLKLTFKKAKKRFCVMQKLVDCFILNHLPVELKWKILTYLSDDDLEYILRIVETY